MRNRSLYLMISRQALLTVGAGLLVALALLALLNEVVGRVDPSISMQLNPGHPRQGRHRDQPDRRRRFPAAGTAHRRVDPATAYRT